jgi:very-short-patch-repair endonuclease
LVARIAAAHHGVFSREHARQCGFSEDEIDRRIRTRIWERLFQSALRDAAAPPSWRGTLLAACWAGGFRAYASHRAAAMLWGLPGGTDRVIEITCPRWRRSQHPDMVIHETKAFHNLDLTYVDRIPTTTPARTLLDLGAVCRRSTVELALDRSVRQHLTSRDELDRVLRRLGRSGRNGAGVLRAILRSRGSTIGKPESEMETRLLQVLRRQGLPAPIPQYEIAVDGVFVARVDLAFPQWKIAIEYDSDEHHSEMTARRRDSDRRNRIYAAGWSPVTATADDVTSGGHNLERAIRAAAKRFGVNIQS